jgi:hypothetical protein
MTINGANTVRPGCMPHCGDQPVDRPTHAPQARSQKILKSAAEPSICFTLNALRRIAASMTGHYW